MRHSELRDIGDPLPRWCNSYCTHTRDVTVIEETRGSRCSAADDLTSNAGFYRRMECDLQIAANRFCSDSAGICLQRPKYWRTASSRFDLVQVVSDATNLYPVAETIAGEVVSLPIIRKISADQEARIVNAVVRFVHG